MKKIALGIVVVSNMLCTEVVFAGNMSSANRLSSEWTGFYFGGNVGGSWADPSVNVTSINSFINTEALSTTGQTYGPAAAISATGSFPERSSNVLGGLQLGYNHQIKTKFVAGIETDIQVLDSANHSTLTQVAPRVGYSPNTVTTDLAVSQRSKYLGTLRGRLGIFIPHFNSWLAYFTGGLAYGGVQSSTNINGEQTPNTGSTGFSGSGGISTTRTGYTIGGGVEKFVASRWGAKIEYLYYDLGTVSYNNGALTTYLNGTTTINFINNSSSSVRFNGNLVRAGLNFHFA